MYIYSIYMYNLQVGYCIFVILYFYIYIYIMCNVYINLGLYYKKRKIVSHILYIYKCVVLKSFYYEI